MANEYSEFQSKWNLGDWQAYCPNMEYRIVDSGRFPPFLPTTLTSQFNCGMVVASGSDTNATFVFQGYRVDGNELDEHQYIVSYDLVKNISYAGFIHHADYTNRTTQIPAEMQRSMSLSGINIPFPFPRKPPEQSGSVQQLIDRGLIDGFTNSVEVQNKNKT